MQDTANTLAGLLFALAFARVLLSDVSAAGGASGFGGIGAPIGASIGKTVQEIGPSVAIGLLIVQVRK